MVPTKDRNHSSIYLEYLGEGLLFDCGEGTQRQIRIAGLKAAKISKLFISHWHGDHTLGIPGLIQTMGNSEYQGTLQIIGPKGTKLHMEHIMKGFVFACKVKFEVIEIEQEGVVADEDRYQVEAYPLKHKTLTYGYRFVEKDRLRINLVATKKLGIPEGPLLGKLQKGKAITWKDKKYEAKELTTTVKGKTVGIVTDTMLCKNCYTIAQDAHLLVSEATYSHELAEMAKENMHMTTTQAAGIARDSNVKKLILTHISQRYKTPDIILKEAKAIFPDVQVAEDFLHVKV